MMEKLFYTSGTTALPKKKKVMVDGNNFSIKESVELLHVFICLARSLSSIKILHVKRKTLWRGGNWLPYAEDISKFNIALDLHMYNEFMFDLHE